MYFKVKESYSPANPINPSNSQAEKNLLIASELIEEFFQDFYFSSLPSLCSLCIRIAAAFKVFGIIWLVPVSNSFFVSCET